MAFISKVLSLIIAAVTALCGFLFPPNVEVPQVAEGQVRIPVSYTHLTLPTT